MDKTMENKTITQPAAASINAYEVHHSTIIHAQPEQVYTAFTTSHGLDAWFTEGAVVDARPGGMIKFKWVNWGPDRVSTEDDGPVLEAIPAERFVFQWHPDQPDYATTVEITLRPIENGTIIRLREYGFADTPSAYAAMIDCATGWGEALTLLKFYVEYGVRY
jgi:uncharacterized protein YndB with AHSA1/START domain